MELFFNFRWQKKEKQKDVYTYARAKPCFCPTSPTYLVVSGAASLTVPVSHLLLQSGIFLALQRAYHP